MLARNDLLFVFCVLFFKVRVWVVQKQWLVSDRTYLTLTYIAFTFGQSVSPSQPQASLQECDCRIVLQEGIREHEWSERSLTSLRYTSAFHTQLPYSLYFKVLCSIQIFESYFLISALSAGFACTFKVWNLHRKRVPLLVSNSIVGSQSCLCHSGSCNILGDRGCSSGCRSSITLEPFPNAGRLDGRTSCKFIFPSK